MQNCMHRHCNKHELHDTRHQLHNTVDVLPRGDVCQAPTRRATFVLSILALAPVLCSPWEIHQVDRTGPEALPAFQQNPNGHITPAFSGPKMSGLAT